MTIDKRVDRPDFEMIFEAVPLPCIIVDPDFDIVAVNDAYLAATLTDRSIVGRNFLEVFPDNPDDPLNPGNSNLRASLERARRDLVADSMPVQKYDIPRPDGTGFEERFWSPTNAAVLASDGSLAYIIHSARDVTSAMLLEKASTGSRAGTPEDPQGGGDADASGWILEQTRAAAAASRELKEANAELSRRAVELTLAHERADRASAAKSEFLSRMSHELRTPLNAILGFAQLLDMDDLEAEQHAAIDHITTAGRHLVALVNDILDLERVEAGRLPLSIMPVALDAVLGSVVELTAPLAAGRGVSVTVAGAEEPVWALADERRLTQILINLVGNAIKYTPTGGRVLLVAEAADGTARIRVEDNGPGMRPEDLQRAFEPFERLDADDARTEGAGLGLALARGLAEAMGGSIEAVSSPGLGSTFTVVLQRAQAAAPDPLDDQPTRAGHGGRDGEEPRDDAGGDILCVEDNPNNLTLIRRIARRRPAWRLDSATSVAEAMGSLDRCPPDLLLLDLHLPDGNGLEVLQRVRGDDEMRHIPVIVLTADAMSTTRAAVLEAGADVLLTKPFDVRDLEATIDLLLAGGRDAAHRLDPAERPPGV